VPTPDIAPQAEYVPSESLGGDGVRHLLDVDASGEYARVVEPTRAFGLANIGAFDLRSRLELGHVPAYAVGLDGDIGGTNQGVYYGVTAYPVGVGAVFGQGNVVSLLGGAGFNRLGDAVPIAARFPVEVAVGFELGPIRPELWVRPSWIDGASVRKDGSFVRFIDELEAGLLVRLSRQHRLWTTTTAGGGFAIGFWYYEFEHTRSLGASLGFDFVGGR
jgi:hypothetical protein